MGAGPTTDFEWVKVEKEGERHCSEFSGRPEESEIRQRRAETRYGRGMDGWKKDVELRG
ncbi:hypothetical protein BCR33DRAFT_722814 [Rhizoclosmatium globosum]|uniref:Uncharacterized protein n=1 Tax=Rhizoclosmatium globosum TaxID=329046 RepID=A0A1Y2BIP0_9FUNG|nr:hypothetical protein BCR33DRAFT_722814 [Rhizoclosmatium globosum]|eukprot:ORY34417.1 hypothetical protein BCR33DRAFT_722814 [Rhizoclosmatium globosum]